MAAGKKAVPKISKADTEAEVLGIEENKEVLNPEKEVTFTPTVNSKPIERNVKVRFARDYKGCIGGKWYYFKKNEVANIPESVKIILNRAEGILKPL